MVVDPQVDPAVVATAVAACRTDDEEGRRLAPTGIAAGLIARREGRQQPVRQGSLRSLEGRQCVVDHSRPDEDVALDRHVLRRPTPGPGQAGRPRVGGRAAVGVHDAELTLGRGLVHFGEGSDDGRGVVAPSKPRKPIRTVRDVRKCLARDRADPRLRPGHDRPDRQELRGHGHAEVAGRGIAGDDREGHRSPRPSNASIAATKSSLSGAGWSVA